MTNFLTVYQYQLEYLVFGNGSKTMIAFHGFGRNANDFKAFDSTLGKEYTIYSFNLFLHGKSNFLKQGNYKEVLHVNNWKEIIEKFIVDKKIDKFSLMGYSLGGKMALLTLELFPERIESIWLFAPDGVKKSFWYHFVSKTRIGEAGYNFFLKNPQTLFFGVNLLFKTGLINAKIKKFVIGNMESKEQRELVRDVWMIFRNTNPSMKNVISSVSEFDIDVIQVYGRFDKVIQYKFGQRFARKINQSSNLHILETGHTLITNKTNQVLSEIIQKMNQV